MWRTAEGSYAHILIPLDTRTRTAIISISRWKGGARITKAEATWMTSAITRERVAVTLPLTVKVQKMRRSLRAVIMGLAVISVAVTEKSKVHPRKMTNRTIHRLGYGLILRCINPLVLRS